MAHEQVRGDLLVALRYPLEPDDGAPSREAIAAPCIRMDARQEDWFGEAA